MTSLTNLLNETWQYKISLAPVLLTFLIFEAPALVRRWFRWFYTPVYFIFFPLGHSDQLYAQYFNEDDHYLVGASQTEDEKRALRSKIIAISIVSMIFSTAIAPSVAGFISAFYLFPDQFNEFLWFLIFMKTTTILYSLAKLRNVSFIYKSGSFYFLGILYVVYLAIICRLVIASYHWTHTNLQALGVVKTLAGLADFLVVEVFAYVIVVGLGTWAITHFFTNPAYIPTPDDN